LRTNLNFLLVEYFHVQAPQYTWPRQKFKFFANLDYFLSILISETELLQFAKSVVCLRTSFKIITINMYTLGISEIDNDSGVVLLKNSEVIGGVSEERFTRKKRHAGFPHRSVEWLLANFNLSINDISHIAIAKADPKTTPERFNRQYKLLKKFNYFDSSDPSSLIAKSLNFLIHRFRNLPRSYRLAKSLANEIDQWILTNSCGEKVVRVPHHYAHAQCAYWASGYEECLAVTLDGQGEGITSSVYHIKNGEFDLIKETLVPHSLGVFYASVTKALGFKPSKHEGKVTGLAAYGNPDEELLFAIESLAYSDSKGNFYAPTVYGNYLKILKLVKKHGRENVSAAFQIVLEKVATEYVGYFLRDQQCSNLVLAGGVVANVKLNQAIHQLKEVKNIFIFPHMADGGLGYGAAQYVYRNVTKDTSLSPIKDVYWGPEYSSIDIENSLKSFNLNYKKCSDTIVSEIVDCLIEKKVVAHFHGRMEFGPRSLGNRSILYSTIDPSVNSWLNTKLNRSEFMPFAPATLAEYADECYVGLSGAERTSEFMTITCGCTPKMQNDSPAVVHVDKTARPQLVYKDRNPRYHAILSEYYRRTGIPSLVNTSFNMHEEPIVCSPDDAIRAFIDGKLDVLAIGEFIVYQSELFLNNK
jgi:carbamoyltransferase